MVTRDIHDVLESITIIYNDGRVEVPDFFKVGGGYKKLDLIVTILSEKQQQEAVMERQQRKVPCLPL